MKLKYEVGVEGQKVPKMDTDKYGQRRKTDGHREFSGRPFNGVLAARHMLGKFKVLSILLIVVGLVVVSIGNALTQGTPTLGMAASFGVLGGSTVTNTGDTIVNGDLGVAPGLAVTGFPPGIVVPPGEIHAGDAVAEQAQSDLTVAYNALASQACNTNLTGLDLGGLILTSGIYCFDTSAQLTGELTLNLEGDPEALFIFQMGSTLTTAPGASVVFVNGAPSCNVFWQVGSSATLDTATSFAGNIVALTSITLNTSASVDGRVLARNGAVTMDNNHIALCVESPTETDTPLPATQTVIAATQTAIAPTLTAIAMTPTPTFAPPTQTAIAATQTVIAATQIAVAPTLTAIAMTPTPTQTAIAMTPTPTQTAIAMTPTPTNTLAPLALEESEQPPIPIRLYLPLIGH